MVSTKQQSDGKIPKFVKQRSFSSIQQFASTNPTLKDHFVKLAYSAQHSPIIDSKQCNNYNGQERNAAKSAEFFIKREHLQRKMAINQQMNSLTILPPERKAKSLCGVQTTTHFHKALKHHILEKDGRKNSLNLITQKAKSMQRKISEFAFAHNEPLVAAGKAIGLIHLVTSTSGSLAQPFTATKKGQHSHSSI